MAKWSGICLVMFGYEVVCLTNRRLEKKVRDPMMSRDIQAIKFIPVWWARVGRIPAGVDRTHSLLVAITTTQHTPLSLATAVNRFLNHVSHLAMHMWGLRKLHELGSC